MQRKWNPWRRGEITVFVSLLLAVLLGFFEVCMQSAKSSYFRSETEEALELMEFSVLSEYHRELLEEYDLFYLDLGYGAGAENQGYVEQRMRQFLDKNLSGGETTALEAFSFSRATDEQGMAFYEQAVSCMKQKTGASLLEVFQSYEDLGREAGAQEDAYREADARESANLEELRKRREAEEEKTAPDPIASVHALKNTSILHLVLGEPEKASGKQADISKIPSARTCLSGAGARGKYSGNLANDAFFLGYLQEHFTDAADFLSGEERPGKWLDYQLEYIIAGKDSDIENLEAVCGRLLAMREGMNYAYLRTDAGRVAECEALAAAMVGFTMIPGLVEAVREVLLLVWSFGESVMDVRMLLEGKRIAFQKSAGTWRVSLAEALEPGRSSGQTGDAGGLSYQDYLGILLTLTARETKTARSLDVIEGVIRGGSGNAGFYIDQCTDSFRVRAVVSNGQEWTAERWICYEW